MATPLRDYYSDEYIAHISEVMADEVGKSNANDILSFIKADPWDDMALKERTGRLTDMLTVYLPKDYREAIPILKRIMVRVSGGVQRYDDMLSMFVPDYIPKHGLEEWELSMDALAYCTSHGTTSEFAIRPFIMANQEKAMEQMLRWAKHAHSHVRRLASEGCRPRLPWAPALPGFKKDPSLILPILKQLHRDESDFVQRSVANNLNDIAKDHSDVVVAFVKAHQNKGEVTDWILKHGSRTLLKQAHPEILSLFGMSSLKLQDCQLTLSEQTIMLGEKLHFSFSGQIEGVLPERLRVSYAIDFMKKNGAHSRKIFHLSDSVPTSSKIELSRYYDWKARTTRKHYAGSHNLAIIINGQEVASVPFTLVFP